MEATEQIKVFQEFLERNYKVDLLEAVRKGKQFMVVDFGELASFSPELSDQLIDQPEEVLRAAEIATEQFDLPSDIHKITIRIKNMPKSQSLMIRDVRSKNIGKLHGFEGIVRQKSDVRPQVTQAKFECPSCGNVISVLQLDTKFKEPSRCGCGRKGKFRLVHKELVDAQGLVLEEAPDNLEGGEQPKRMNVFLKNDLVSPIGEKKTNPGQYIKLTGHIKEIPIITRQGNQSTRFDLLIEANYVESVEEDYTDITINPAELVEIEELSRDPRLVQRLVKSVAPSIFGHDKIKEALILQMLGGVKKTRDDGSVTRGDMHILLIGDPGAGKSQLLKRITNVAPKSRYVSGKGATAAGLCVSPRSMLMTNPGGMQSIANVVEDRLGSPSEFRPGIWKRESVEDIKIQSMDEDLRIQSKHPSTIWKLEAPEMVFEVSLSSGKKVELTGNTKLFTIQNGKTTWKRSMELAEGDFVATPRKLIGGDIEKQHVADLIQSNPVVHKIKPFVREVVSELSNKYGSLRAAAKALDIREDQLYYNWVNEKARGNIKLRSLAKICSDTGIDYRKHVREVSLYNGKKHRLPEYLTDDVLYVAGLIAGDGDISASDHSYAIRLSNSDSALHDAFRRTLQDRFGLSYNITNGNAARPEATRTSSKMLAEILMSLGIMPSPKSSTLAMSETLLHLSNGLLSSFIAGLYDSDGSVHVRNEGGSSAIELYTTSETLAKQLQLALLRYEIHSSIRKKKPTQGRIRGKHPVFIVTVSGYDDIKRYAESFKLKHQGKARKIAALAARLHKPHTNTDILPGVGEHIRPILQENGIPLKTSGWHPNLSRNALKRLVKHVGTEEHWKLANSDIFWEKVTKIVEKKPDYEYVYDLTVEDSHNFVVDGVLVHNTASVVRDEFLSGWSLEAGALVLANKGIVMIDELDKMGPEDRAAMHEALEQQTVTISKANIQATLRAETTVLAAANPKFGRFDPYETLAKQIELPATLINRFDLIFAIRDMPDEERDSQMADFILNLHQNPDSQMPDIPTGLIRKYISYAKQTLRPSLTDSAITEIKAYYLKMRGSGTEEGSMKSIPISARQIEALIRLAEASAKMRLSDKVLKKDAKRAVDLVHYCLQQVGMDPETGQIDIDRISTGVGASERSKIFTVRDIIAELESQHGKTINLDDVVREAGGRGLDEDIVGDVIERLKRSGDIFEPKPGFIQRI